MVLHLHTEFNQSIHMIYLELNNVSPGMKSDAEKRVNFSF